MFYLFVGERPSITAYCKGWTWRDGRLAAATLFEALLRKGVAPLEQGYVNLFGDHPDSLIRYTTEAQARAAVISEIAKAGVMVVALGRQVEKALNTYGIPNRAIRHPAARGAGRAREIYINHICETL